VIRAREEIGGDLTLDAVPLDPMSELGHVLLGASTFTVYESDGHAAWRSPLHLRHRPAGTRPRETVHPAHRCSGRIGS
jgi:hypothetical protein